MKREELKERRTAYRKIYENEDHSMTAEIYLEPVHYQDEDGSWKEMDDTLVEAEAEDTDEESASDNKDLKNEKGSLKIRFHNKMKKQGTISMKKGDEQLLWTLEDAAKVKGEKTGPSEVLYQNVYKGMDLHCRVCSEKVKEDIVVQDKENAPSSITYLYQVKKLTPESDRRKYRNTLVPVRFPWQSCITAIWKQPICILTKYPERHHRSD